MSKCILGTRLSWLALCALTLAACNLDVTNPNQPPEEKVLADPEGVIGLGIGLQAQFSQSIDDYLVPSSLVTDEWGTKTRALLSYQSLMTGLSFENTYDVVSLPYANTYQMVRSANILLNTVPTHNYAAPFAAGFNALVKLFKAMALGNASLIYAQLPVGIEAEGAVPQPRAVVQDTVLALLNSARADLANVADADLGTFNSRLLGTGLNLRNTIDAMIARYSLFRGLYQQANDAALRVSPTVLSVISYPTPTVNPVWNLGFGLIYIAGLKSFADQAEPGDKRPAYWLVTTTSFKGTPDSTLHDMKKYGGRNDPFPLYLPDEMKLIRAEAQARLGNLQAAIDLINQVRVQTTSTIDEPTAGLTALTAAQLPDLTAVLKQIAYERRYELFEQGLRWEDTRRFGSGGNTVTFQFLPLPAVECRANPNAGCT